MITAQIGRFWRRWAGRPLEDTVRQLLLVLARVVPDGLDVVTIGIQYEGRVVAG
jgi:hypothetical protein